jgi:hypothetical protein
MLESRNGQGRGKPFVLKKNRFYWCLGDFFTFFGGWVENGLDLKQKGFLMRDLIVTCLHRAKLEQRGPCGYICHVIHTLK